MNKRVSQLGNWLAENMTAVEPIVVSGGLRGDFDPQSPVLDALELSGPLGTTVRLLVPAPPPQEKPGSASTFLLVKKKDGPNDEKVLPDPERYWWDGWAKIFTASALLPPRTDSVRLADVLRDERVLRLFCDTNALASGVAEWFLHVLPSGTQLISSAIADKEIMSWVDRHKKLYEGSTAETWEARLRYLLARRLTEYPPQHTVIDRLSPDQNALMLAQGTGEGGSKSSQGDLLFVELARPLVREQPRQARVIFLTGDANVARAATSALGPEHVLYANPDTDTLKERIGKVVPRGFWHPAGPLGSLSLPSSSRLLWNLLSAFTFLIVKQAERKWLIEPIFNVRYGGPSDWADPWVHIKELSKPTDDDRAHVPTGSPDLTASAEVTKESVLAPQAAPTPVAMAAPKIEQREPKADAWLLPGIKKEGPADAVTPSPRPAIKPFFGFLSLACFGEMVPLPSAEVPRETFRVLVALKALNEDGSQGDRITEFKEAWLRNNRDWFHAELMHSHPGYRQVVAQIRAGNVKLLKSREAQFVPLIRTLGQAARFPSSSSPIRMGDDPVSFEQLDEALHRWLPHPDTAIRIGDACERAMADLSLTPCRFELALSTLWKRQPDYPVESRTGGEPDRMSPDDVVELNGDGTYELRTVSPSTLTFGGAVPVLFLARRR